MKRVFGVFLFAGLSLLVVVTGINQPTSHSGDSSGQVLHPPSEAASSASAEAMLGK